jgi:hypothetical protein
LVSPTGGASPATSAVKETTINDGDLSMHKQLTAAELEAVQRAHPVTPMTRQEKLSAWAELVEKYEGNLILYHRLEYVSQQQLDDTIFHAENHYTPSAILLAIRHEPFQAEGIGNSVGSVMRFFELSKAELHEFSCDCGGVISNEDQAKRIRNLAQPAPARGLVERIADVIF